MLRLLVYILRVELLSKYERKETQKMNHEVNVVLDLESFEDIEEIVTASGTGTIACCLF